MESGLNSFVTLSAIPRQILKLSDYEQEGCSVEKWEWIRGRRVKDISSPTVLFFRYQCMTYLV